MPGAWELVVTWHGEPVRADLLQGRVRVSAAGPTAGDIPLPLDTRQPLLRGNASSLDLLPVAGATWAIEGQPPAGSARLASDQGPARLAVGNLEVAVQGTEAPPTFPRFVALDAALVRVAVHLAAAILVGLTLATEPADPPVGLPLAPARRAVPTAEARPRAPIPVTLPRVLAHDPLDDERGRRVPSRRRALTARVESPGPTEAAEVDLPSLDAPRPWPPELDVEPAVDSLADLASTSLRIASAGRGSAATGRGGAAGGMGSCAGPYFDLLARRYGRDTAIVACSPGVQFERRAARHEAVLQERAGSALAPEVWSYEAQPSARDSRARGQGAHTRRTDSVSSTGDAAPSEKSRTSISR